ncbi:MAG TPA: phenylalanine--tRNA ligase subunit alpha, partial [Armatimonadetes bacterium]|nr:phenylalanine--tRNA ligase subunit alpha [Armatimonadota bacterium]
GRKGEVTRLLKGIGELPPEERPLVGRLANELRERIRRLIEERRRELEAEERKRRFEAERLDVTMPGRFPRLGRLHPLTQVMREVEEIFIALGFEVVQGPEVETEWYNFVALNIPDWHPVRDEHDSFYITEEILLRTETSAVQIRTMERRKPPVRIISPGRCYRRDPLDATHSPIFHQVEGLWVEKGVTFAHLKGVLEEFARRMFGKEVKMRFRPDYFPFTEPSADASISCVMCGGRGCPVCKHTGWLEILGAGMVHPNVLRNVGYDPEEVTGLAFGMGLERIAMLKYGIDDIRLFYENDVRFLEQF